jgi:hypothetical protein
MNVEARSRGLQIVPTGSKSSYRTYAQQQELYRAYLSGMGNLAAKPGTSNHGWGLAVDVASQAMRAMIDRIGGKYGWAKKWSDAPTEWWHIKYAAGIWSGIDPGPFGVIKPPAPLPITEADMIAAVVKKNGAIEVFVEKPDGQVWHTWQNAENSAWWGSKPGQNAAWQSLGNPGK